MTAKACQGVMDVVKGNPTAISAALSGCAHPIMLLLSFWMFEWIRFRQESK